MKAWVENDAGFFTCVVGRAVTRGEEALLRLRWPDGWLIATGFEVVDAQRSREVDASVTTLWRVIEGIGGSRGWYSFPLAWRVRGLLDRLVGGVGLRRGRRDPERVYVGESIDFWRVEERDVEQLLRLRAEMRLPGLAWLEFHVEHEDDGNGTAAADGARPIPV